MTALILKVLLILSGAASPAPPAAPQHIYQEVLEETPPLEALALAGRCEGDTSRWRFSLPLCGPSRVLLGRQARIELLRGLVPGAAGHSKEVHEASRRDACPQRPPPFPKKGEALLTPPQESLARLAASWL